MLGSIGEKVGIAVLTALILGTLGLLANFASSGGIVRLLGGIPESDRGTLRAAAIPSGAVIAFDLPDGCPTEGWTPFRAAESRAIVGAASGQGFETGLGVDPSGTPLTGYKYREHGGFETVALTTGQMPRHDHGGATGGADLAGIVAASESGGPVGPGFGAKFDAGPDHAHPLAAEGGPRDGDLGSAEPHPNMPPFLALHYCRKD